MIAKSRKRFPACAKPAAPIIVWLDASAGEGRSEKIMRQPEGRSGWVNETRRPGRMALKTGRGDQRTRVSFPPE
jgi:hypothetical protein